MSRRATTFDHKRYLAGLTTRPGVYRMLDGDGKALYVGKARNLRNRVGSYFHASGLAAKTIAMINRVADIEVIVTANETEALLLEQSLIKEQRPAYNIQLRDDKSYPYILLTDRDEFPRLAFYRGKRKRAGRLFGPYPSAHATRETLQILQKVFQMRQCEDSFFRNRSRPCLQYQIDRCTAPCVGLISREDYARDVHYSTLFLQGRSDRLIRELTKVMEQAAARREFEKAATVRDQISGLRRIQEQQFVANQGKDADVLVAQLQQPYTCVHAIYVRAGRVIGSKSFHPRHRLADSEAELLAAFISRTYLGDDRSGGIPAEIIVPCALEDGKQLEEALSWVAGRRVKLAVRVRGHRAKWLQLATANARESLQAYLAKKQNMSKKFKQLKDILDMESGISRIECFDISHTGGESTVASCVVFDDNGPVRNDYRRFNIRDIQAGDDYAAMQQVLNRRFKRLAAGEGKLPDLLLIDGGKGQLRQAREVLEKFGLPHLPLLGIAKGVSRRAGEETLYLGAGAACREVPLAAEAPALHLLQQIRDEAHRFAISGHRRRRDKARKQSSLEEIPGLGPKRRRELIKHFGGRREISQASVEELTRVTGINRKVAENIHAYLHEEGASAPGVSA